MARALSGDAADALREARDRIEDDLTRRPRALRLPDRVLAEGLPEARVSCVRKPARRVRVARGRCVRMVHSGPYSDEPASLARMDALMRAEGLVPHGLHHEVYLTDPRESDPEKIRVIWRRPVR